MFQHIDPTDIVIILLILLNVLMYIQMRRVTKYSIQRLINTYEKIPIEVNPEQSERSDNE